MIENIEGVFELIFGTCMIALAIFCGGIALGYNVRK